MTDLLTDFFAYERKSTVLSIWPDLSKFFISSYFNDWSSAFTSYSASVITNL